MKLAVSTIAWANEEEKDIAMLLRGLGVEYVEVAPTKIWADPTKASDSEMEDYKQFWRTYGIEIVAIQSMLFSRPDLKIFENEDNRKATLEYLKDFIVISGKLGAKRMVFGSPKNRQRGGISLANAMDIAVPFFRELARTAQESDVIFCIEPNAPQYACDFITTAKEGIDLVRVVDAPGFALHLDTACMTLAGDNIAESVGLAGKSLKHFHISAPMLVAVNEESQVDHESAADMLHEIDYDGYASIEMRPAAKGNLERVREAIAFAQDTYL